MFRLPLVHDRRQDRRTPVASLEISETDLRLLSVACAHSAVTAPIGWRHADDTQAFDALSRRMKRVADELRKVNQNGAAPVVAGPRHDSQEALS